MSTCGTDIESLRTTALNMLAALFMLALITGKAHAQNISGLKEAQTLDGQPLTSLEVGQTFRYRLIWQCSFTSAPPATGCGDFELVDTLPMGLTVENCIVTSDYACASGPNSATIEEITGSLNLGDGDSAEAFVVVKVSSDPADYGGTLPTEIVNTATITSGEPTIMLSSTVPLNSPTNNWKIGKSAVIPIDPLQPALDVDSIYDIEICPDGPAGIGTGTIPLTDVVLTDACDPNADFIGATRNGIAISPEPTAMLCPNLQFSLGTLNPDNGCDVIRITLQYPSSDFALGDSVDNIATAVDAIEGGIAICDGPCMNITTQTIAAPNPDANISKSTRRSELSAGALSRYTFAADLNDSNVPLASLEIVDTFPAGVAGISLSGLSWSDDSVLADVYALGTNTQIASGFNGDSDLAPINYSFAAGDTGFRIEFTTDVPPGFVMSGPTVNFRTDISLTVGTTLQNCADVTGSFTDAGGSTTNVAEQACVTDTIIAPRADISAVKTMPSSLAPGEEFIATFGLSQDFSSSTGAIDPVIVECLPPELLYVSWDDVTFTGVDDPRDMIGTSNDLPLGVIPNLEIFAQGDAGNTCAMPNGGMLRWSWNNTVPPGALQLGNAPGVQNAFTFPVRRDIAPLDDAEDATGDLGLTTGVSVQVTLQVVPGTLATPAMSTIDNIAIVQPASGSYQCTSGEVADAQDLDADGSVVDLNCQDTEQFVVIAAAAFGGQKFIGGFPGLENIDPANPPADANAGDTGITPAYCPQDNPIDSRTRAPCVAQGMTGQPFNYQVRLSNNGNIPLVGYVAYDILPYLGDTGITQLQSGSMRGSSWTAEMLGPVVVSTANPVVQAELDKIGDLTIADAIRPKLEYSASTNPCRDEMAQGTDGPWQGGACDDDWTESPLADPITFPDGYGSVAAWRLVLPFDGSAWPTGDPMDLAAEDVVVDITMAVPAGTPGSVYDADTLEIAWNNIAHRATAQGGGRLLAAEMRKTGIVVPAPFPVSPDGVRIGNLVWMDTDNDGIAELGEPGLYDVTVQLWSDTTGNGPSADDVLFDVQQTDAVGHYLFDDSDPRGADGLLGTADDVRDNLGFADGNYYVVIPNAQTGSFNVSQFYSSAGGNANADGDIDNDDNGATSTVAEIIAVGGDRIDGIYSGTVALDTINEPQDETDRFDSTLDDDDDDFFLDAPSNTSVDFGFYQLRLGNHVWLDDGAGANTNNGVADGDEPAIEGMEIQLWVDDGNGVFDPLTDTRIDADPSTPAIDSVITDANGQYLYPALAEGDYFVAIPSGQTGLVADGITYSTDGLSSSGPVSPAPALATDNRDDGVAGIFGGTNYAAVSPLYELVAGSGTGQQLAESDSSLNGITGASSTDVLDANVELTINLANNASLPDVNSFLTADFGFSPLVSLGSTVWEDLNGNGQQDANETPLVGAEVTLLNADGTIYDSDLTVAGIQPLISTTNAAGEYNFNDLLPGTYRVQVDLAAVTEGGLYLPTPLQVSNANNDSNADSNITYEAAFNANTTDTIFVSEQITLANGDEPTGEVDAIGLAVAAPDQPMQDADDLDVSGNMTLDLGFVRPVSVGSTLWLDENVDGLQTLGEAPIVGAEVTLLNADGSEFDSDPYLAGTQALNAVTDADGQYNFNELPAGDYRVRVDLTGASNLNVGRFLPTPSQVGNPNDDNNADSNIDLANAANSNADDVWLSGIVELRRGDEPTAETDPIGAVGADQPNQDLTPADDPDNSGNMTVDFGFQPFGSIGDYVYFDLNGDGVQDAVESGIGGVTVMLEYVDFLGVPQSLTTTTAIDGSYLFEGLPLNLPPLLEYTITVDTTTLPGILDTDLFLTADPDAVDDNTSMVSLTTANPDAVDQDFGYQPRGVIGDTVWYDANFDGVLDATEQGIAGVTLTLQPPALVDAGAGPGVAVTTITDVNGNYLFRGLLAGEYDVTVDFSTLPADTYQATFDDDGVATANTSTTTLVLDNTDPTMPFVTADIDQDFGYVEPVSVGGFVWEDENGDGIQGPAEPPVTGSTVSLLVDDGTGVFVAATDLTNVAVAAVTIGVDGQYIFDNLPEGDYKVLITKPIGFQPTPVQNTADDDDAKDDSNIAAEPSTAVYESGVFTILRGSEPSGTDEDLIGDDQDDGAPAIARDESGNMTIDFGFVRPLSIGSLVWIDENNDGIQDSSEPPLPGTTVELLQLDSISSTYVPAVDSAGVPVSAVVTGVDGLYEFTNLAAGDYKVQVTPPAGFLPADIQVGADNDDSIDDSNIDATADGSDNAAGSIPAGTYESGIFTLAIGGEPNEVVGARGDGQDGVSGGSADLNGNMTVDFGFRELELSSLGNYVWLDENSDGLQDAGEAGIPGVTIVLYDDQGNELARTQTNADGGYVFNELLPGNYYVDVEDGLDGTADTLPQTGMTQTSTITNPAGDFGNQDHSSTAIPGAPAGQTGYAITLGEADFNPTADFGYNHNPDIDVNDNINNAALGNRIWIDSNGNGVQDTSEVPVEGVVVSLFTDPDGDGVFDTPAGTRTTDISGNYLFDDLVAGAYVVTVTDSAGASHNILDAGAYQQSGDPDHFAAAAATAQPGEAADNTSTGPIVLSNGDVFLNVDFGYQPIAGVAPVGSIGDTVWLDIDADGSGPNIPSIDGQLNPSVAQGNNLQDDSAEPTIAGVTVALAIDSNGDGIFDPDGLDNTFGTPDDEPVVADDITDANGQYLFDGLAFGDYLVVVDDTNSKLRGLTASFDANGTAGTPGSSAVTIDAVTPDVRDQDFGYTPGAPVGSIGDTIWADLDSSGGDQGTQGAEPGLSGVTVNLYVDSDGIPGPDDINGDGVANASDAIATTTADASGVYLFDELPIGDYLVEVDDSTLPAGYLDASTFVPVAGADDAGPAGGDLSAVVSLSATDPHDRVQDFSYPPDGTVATIGDLIWGDINNDGEGPDSTDPDEPRLAGVTVRLFDTTGALVAITKTGVDGRYSFTGLDPTATYTVEVDPSTLPAGYQPVPSGDPEGDGNNSSVVNLNDGGVGSEDGVNDPDGENSINNGQDFGYPPVTPNTPLGSIGDTLWFDENSSADDQSNQGAEPGIPGATVTLFTDPNGDGDPVDGVVVEVQVTDENGGYLFQGLSLDDGDGDADYVVVISTATLPGYVNPVSSYEQDGVNNSSSSIALTTADPTNTDQDFSYPPQLALASIGDTIFIDNGDTAGAQDPNDTPVAGVLVNLLDAGGSVIATTLTDLNGRYFFTGLDTSATYGVQVDAANFVGGGVLAGMTNNVDPDGVADGASQVILPDGDGNADEDGPNNINLGQDFGYVATTPVNVGNLVWLDKDADGVYEPDGLDGVPGTADDETPIGGVTVELYRDLDGNGQVDPGEPLFGQAVTSDTVDAASFLANGNYLFADLPADNYVVKVTDDDAVLTGYWQSVGAAMTDDNSQLATYAVDATLADNLTADFGYYVDAGSIGDVVWEDLNGNGLYDPATEPGIDGVTVVLTITNIDGVTTTLVTETAFGGRYRFDNLLLDEDFNGIAMISYGNAGDEPGHAVTLDQTTTPAYLSPVYDSNANPMNTDSVVVGGGLADQDDADVGGDDGIVGEPAFPPMGSIDSTNDFGFALPAAIGNYVWLDLDMDGVQDANENGIPNVTVNLLDATNTVFRTAVTGPNGEYLFPMLLPGSPYTVQVDDSTLPPGLLQTFDEDDGLGATDHTSAPITLLPDEEHLTADFGYTAPPGSIGDIVWIDANDNGVQDPGEPGLAGVEVTLTPAPDVDPDGAGPAAAGTPLTVLTDANGMYLFTGLPLNETYIVTVTNNVPPEYSQSASGLGDPDVRDGNSPPVEADESTIVVLTNANSVNLDADFGYLPDATVNNSIGGVIWTDLDEDGNGPAGAGDGSDAAEAPVAGVTVTLFDSANVPIASTSTDPSGAYLFTGIPDGDYAVRVTDQNNVLAGLQQTADGDDPANPGSFVATTPNQSAVMGLAGGAAVLNQGFGYVDPNNTTGSGSIGNTIFFDQDNSGAADAGEGIEGVTVQLFGPGPDGDITTVADNVLLASTVSNENGGYTFTGLDTSDTGLNPGTDYQVVVVNGSLPNGGVGWTNSVDPDTVPAPGDNTAVVTLTAAAATDLGQNFGYASDAMNAISGTVWPDTNGDGLQGETGVFSGVTIALLDQNGNLIQTTETDASGNYEFTNLPDGLYAVLVTDEDNVLGGYEHTDSPNGSSDTADQTSKDDTGYVVDLDFMGLSNVPVMDETGDFGYKPTVTNPISLGSFVANSAGDGRILVEWKTQTEVANLGFNIYGNVDGNWVQLNDALIPGQGDSVTVQSYAAEFQTAARYFVIGDIDLTGTENLHGAYRLDESYGAIGERRSIDWQAEKTERAIKRAERKKKREAQQRERNQRRKLRRQSSEPSANRMHKEPTMLSTKSVINRFFASVVAGVISSANAQPAGEDIVNLKTTAAGIHQVSYQDLLNYNVDLDGTALADIALLNRGQSVPMQVTGSNADPTRFGPGSVIRFIASTIDTLYSDTNVYTLRLDEDAATHISSETNSIPPGETANAYLATRSYAPQAKYSFVSPNQNDPWYAKRILAIGEPQQEVVKIKLDNVAVGGNTGSTKAKLKVNVWGGTDLPGAGNDHHVTVSVNGAEVLDGSFDGLQAKQMETPLEAVREGNNYVSLRLPMDTGHAFDAINVNEVQISYPRKFVAEADRLDFASTFNKFLIEGFTSASLPGGVADLVVMRQDDTGTMLVEGANVACRTSCVVQLGGTGQLAHYYVSASDALHQPVLDALPLEQDINTGQAAYLIISHPDFIGAAGNNQLETLAAELASEFGSADVVDVEAIYAQYGHHLFGPQAIQDYIRYAADNRGTQTVLLVGGDVYDYRRFETEDTESFIPSIYAATGNNITFAPVDAKYVDLDDDNVPDLPIGRLPVRTASQLNSLLSKRDSYKARNYGGKVLLVADGYDNAQQYDFSSDANEIEADYLGDWSVSKAYVDELGVAQARSDVISGINEGQTLTAFFGHSSTNQWSFSGLFNGPDAAGLNNQGKPTVVTQWGCWNAYYVSPKEDSMGHRFMMEGDQGAVAVMGASTLTNADAERRLARMVFARLSNGERLGEAVTNAKQDYAQDFPNDLDVLLGWTLLGLPELVVN